MASKYPNELTAKLTNIFYLLVYTGNIIVSLPLHYWICVGENSILWFSALLELFFGGRKSLKVR